MSLPKQIAAMAASIVSVVLVLGVPVSAQTAQLSGETASATAPKLAVLSKKSAVKHEPGSTMASVKAAKTATTLTTVPK